MKNERPLNSIKWNKYPRFKHFPHSVFCCYKVSNISDPLEIRTYNNKTNLHIFICHNTTPPTTLLPSEVNAIMCNFNHRIAKGSLCLFIFADIWIAFPVFIAHHVCRKSNQNTDMQIQLNAFALISCSTPRMKFNSRTFMDSIKLFQNIITTNKIE